MPRPRRCLRGGAQGGSAVGGGACAGSSPPGPPRSSSEEATNPTTASAPNPPPTPRAAELLELEASRLLAADDLEVLSRHDFSSLTSLRRCLRLLPILEAGDPSLAARCYGGLFASLGAILSRDPSPSNLPALEVFAESLVFSDTLRRYFAMADCDAPEGSRIFAEAKLCWGDHHILPELVCHHFISSILDEEGFKVFLSSLSWSGNMLQGTAQGISFQGALALVNRTCFFSLPAIVQAHLLLHASRCVSDRDLGMNLLLFERAMSLYVTYLPALCVFNRTGGVKTSLSCLGKERPFDCCIKDTTDQKLRSQINELLSFCQLHSGDDLPIDESEIDRLTEENQHMFHEEVKQQTIMVVKFMLSDILFCSKQKDVHETDVEVSDVIICLAAVLRVICSSLQHILPHFTQMRSANDKGYDVIHESIRLLGQHETNQLHTYDLLGTVGKSFDRKRDSMIMLSHFASLLICCVRRRLGFMWRSCSIMMIMAMNLIPEEESLGTSQFSIKISDESAAFCSTKDGILQDSVWTKMVALRYKTIHELYKATDDYGDGSRPCDMRSSSTVVDRASRRRRRRRTTQADAAGKPEPSAETENAEGSMLPDEADGVSRSTRAKKPNPKYLGQAW